MIITFALREETWSDLVAALGERRETAGFVLAGVAQDADAISLLGRGVYWIPETGYAERSNTRLSIPSAGFVPGLKAAADAAAVAVFVHTHPGGSPAPSLRDDIVDQELCTAALVRTGQPYYASLILGGTQDSPRFTARLYDASGLMGSVDRVRVIGRRLRIIRAHGSGSDIDVQPAFDRHVRAFGRDGQQLLNQLRIGVVGVGGTGSAVVEQLARLGVKHLTLIDPKQVTDTNLTRIHEARRSDIDRPKAAVAADAILAIELGSTVQDVSGSVVDEAVARKLRNLDVIFACTDDERGRAILARLAIWYLIPTIDIGFVIATDDKLVEGLYGRVTTLLPGAACLLCREHITPDGIRNEGLPDEEREIRAAEGYAPGLGDPDPSVGAFTTLTAMFAVNTLLERVIGYSPEAGAATELIVLLHELKLSRNSRPGNPRHYCGDPTKWGRGDMQPFLETSW